MDSILYIYRIIDHGSDYEDITNNQAIVSLLGSLDLLRYTLIRVSDEEHYHIVHKDLLLHADKFGSVELTSRVADPQPTAVTLVDYARDWHITAVMPPTAMAELHADSLKPMLRKLQTDGFFSEDTIEEMEATRAPSPAPSTEGQSHT